MQERPSLFVSILFDSYFLITHTIYASEPRPLAANLFATTPLLGKLSGVNFTGSHWSAQPDNANYICPANSSFNASPGLSCVMKASPIKNA
jgi:hypothetical protein